MTTTSETARTERHLPFTPNELAVHLAQLRLRTAVSPLPTHPGAFGWQSQAGTVTALASRLLHALIQADPGAAMEVAAWWHGPHGDGPIGEAHHVWLEKHVAGSRAVLEDWVTEATTAAVEAKAFTDEWEKRNGGGAA